MCDIIDVDNLLNHQNASIACKRSNMKCWILSDSSYLSVSKCLNRVGRCHFLGNTPYSDKPLENQRYFINTPFHAEASILKCVVGEASEVEVEVAAACVNDAKGVAHRITLIKPTACGMLTNILTPK